MSHRQVFYSDTIMPDSSWDGLRLFAINRPLGKRRHWKIDGVLQLGKC
jgi:hypothetical protein